MFVELCHAPQAASPEAGEATPHAADGLAGGDGSDAAHVPLERR